MISRGDERRAASDLCTAAAHARVAVRALIGPARLNLRLLHAAAAIEKACALAERWLPGAAQYEISALRASLTRREHDLGSTDHDLASALQGMRAEVGIAIADRILVVEREIRDAWVDLQCRELLRRRAHPRQRGTQRGRPTSRRRACPT
jgi:hypothetical protein